MGGSSLRYAVLSGLPCPEVHCCMPVLVALCLRLNRYYTYLANEVIPAWKWGLLRLDMASKRYCHTGFSWFQIGGSGIGTAAIAVRRSSHREVTVMCAILSTLVSGSLPVTDPDHGSVGSKGIITLTSHLSKWGKVSSNSEHYRWINGPRRFTML
jgi:hypothetical protein